MAKAGYIKKKTILSFSFLMLILVFYSLHFGITSRDEPFYLSMPYRFILGDRPFIDEWNILQTASFFILPFIKMYLFFKGSTEGIIIYVRYLHFFCTILLAGLVYISFKKIINKWTALLLSLPCIVFVPYNLHSLSYNTLTMLFLAGGYFLSFLAALEFERHHQPQRFFLSIKLIDLLLFFAGVCHVSAVICYPPMFIISIIFSLCLLSILPNIRTLLGYGAGIVLGGTWFLYILINTGFDNLMIMYQFAKNIQAERFLGVLGYLPLVLKKHRDFFLYTVPISVFMISTMSFFAVKKLKISMSMVAFVFVLALLTTSIGMNNYGNGAVLFLSGIVAFSLLLFFVLRNSALLHVKTLFILIGIPSLIVGVIPCVVSSCSIISSVIGTFPCALITMYYMAISELREEKKPQLTVLSTTTLLIFFLFIGGLQYFNLRHPYEESLSPLQLHYKFQDGPFKGIYTTKDVYIYYTQFAQDIFQVYKPDKRILFFDNFPAGYLFSDMRPATNATWTLSAGFSLKNRYAMIDYFKRLHIKPDIIIKITSVPLPKNYLQYKDVIFKYVDYDPVNQLTKNYQLILRRAGYEIYQAR